MEVSGRFFEKKRKKPGDGNEESQEQRIKRYRQQYGVKTREEMQADRLKSASGPEQLGMNHGSINDEDTHKRKREQKEEAGQAPKTSSSTGLGQIQDYGSGSEDERQVPEEHLMLVDKEKEQNISSNPLETEYQPIKPEEEKQFMELVKKYDDYQAERLIEITRKIAEKQGKIIGDSWEIPEGDKNVLNELYKKYTENIRKVLSAKKCDFDAWYEVRYSLTQFDTKLEYQIVNMNLKQKETSEAKFEKKPSADGSIGPVQKGWVKRAQDTMSKPGIGNDRIDQIKKLKPEEEMKKWQEKLREKVENRMLKKMRAMIWKKDARTKDKEIRFDFQISPESLRAYKDLKNNVVYVTISPSELARNFGITEETIDRLEEGATRSVADCDIKRIGMEEVVKQGKKKGKIIWSPPKMNIEGPLSSSENPGEVYFAAKLSDDSDALPKSVSSSNEIGPRTNEQRLVIAADSANKSYPDSAYSSMNLDDEVRHLRQQLADNVSPTASKTPENTEKRDPDSAYSSMNLEDEITLVRQQLGDNVTPTSSKAPENTEN